MSGTWRCLASLGLACTSALATSGCVPPVQSRRPAPAISLDYKIKERSPAVVDLRGQTVSLVPFEEVVPRHLLYEGILALQPGDSPGLWAANAVRMELEHAGATVQTLPPGFRPRTGLHIAGRVNALRMVSPSWQPGAEVSPATINHCKVFVDVTVEILRDGLVIFSRRCCVRRGCQSDIVRAFRMTGAPSYLAGGLQEAMRELIRTQLLPQVQAAASTPGGMAQVRGVP